MLIDLAKQALPVLAGFYGARLLVSKVGPMIPGVSALGTLAGPALRAACCLIDSGASPAAEQLAEGRFLTFAVAAVLHAVLFEGHLGPVTDQEAGGAGEFIGLLRNNNDRQLFAGQIRTGKIDAFSGVVLIDVDHSSLRTATAGRLKGLQRLSGRFFFCLAWGVVIGSHIGVHFRCCAAPFQAPQ